MGEAKIKLEKKKAEFEKNPEDFINIHDLLFAVVKKNEGKSFGVMNNCRSVQEVFMTKGFADEALQNRRDQIRVMQAQEKHNDIQIVTNMPPLPGSGGGIFPMKG